MTELMRQSNEGFKYNQIQAIQNLTKENLEDEIFKRGPVVAIFGGQLGDEGKGKVTSQFKNVDYVAVGPGGGNAGHTVVCTNGKSIALHELPGGAIIENAKVYMGQGRSVNISGLYKEIRELEENGYNMKNKIIIAGNAQIIFDNLQKKLDRIIEGLKSKKVGTTAKGIGPTAALKALRTGPNFNILLNDNPDQLNEFMKVNCNLFNGLNIDELMKEIQEEKELLQNLIDEGYIQIDSTNMILNQAAHENKRILIELSQSAMLAADGGMYPYNTSNDTSVNGAMSALNLPEVNTRIAVFKSIKSKVGGGFFPTKFEDEEFAENYRKKSGEYGATTKRPRDVGHIDTVEGRKVLKTNRTDIIVFTKTDLLKELGTNAKIGEKYIDQRDGKEYINEIPATKEQYENIQVEYSSAFDLSKDIIGIQNPEDLPEEYTKYIDYLFDKLEFDGNVLLGTGPCPQEFMVYK
ncbi:adenylosuccinate synthetase [Candidatus Gracilibacteria bacterium]|nr:adenylosuccinate synthetase [Candidatus Gracilibacteria bacterium]